MLQAFRTAFSPGATPYFYVLWGLFIGLLLATAVIVVYKAAVGRLVKALKRAAATSPETAKSLAELGFSAGSPLRFLLRKGSTLRRVIYQVGDEPIAVPKGAEATKKATTEGVTEGAMEATKPAEAISMSKNTENAQTLPTVEPKSAAYYLSEKQSDRATALFDRHDLNPVMLALTPVALFAVMILLFWLIPFFT